MAGTVTGHLEARIAAGEIDADPAQLELARRLDALVVKLGDLRLARKTSTLGWLFARRAPEPPRGLYIFGEVGRGKTMLMDLFVDAVPMKRKRRAHFHGFMADVHARIHAARQAMRAGTLKEGDPIPGVAAQIAEESRLLAFDEFHVTDIADAMILGRLFEQLFGLGVVLVATSNVPPEGLYKDGLNRALFLPFIALLERHVEVVRLDARTDFRRDKLIGLEMWHVPADAAARAALDAAFARLTAGAPPQPTVLEVLGRQVVFPVTASGVLRTSFAELCGKPLGATDYLALARRFHTVVLDEVPVLVAERRNDARRFLNLIDALYDEHVKLVASAAAEPDDLVAIDTGYEAFAAARLASRLAEMRSSEWLELPHGRTDSTASGTAEGLVET